MRLSLCISIDQSLLIQKKKDKYSFTKRRKIYSNTLTVNEVRILVLLEVHGRDPGLAGEVLHLEADGLAEDQAHRQVAEGPHFLAKKKIYIKKEKKY